MVIAKELEEQIVQQGDEVRRLKSDKATSEVELIFLVFINLLKLYNFIFLQEVKKEAIDKLLKLKLAYKEATGQDYAPAGGQGGGRQDKKKVNLILESILHF